MLPALRLLTDIAATYRLTKLVLDDEVLRETRDALFARFPPESTKTGYLLTCPWCVSVWAGLAIFTLRRASPNTLADIVSGALAASAVTGHTYERIG